ncbi:MAG: tetratricopeptide repeat protein, partial [Candidatus Obscuribacterales bacterium]|nr:tetratricopeptide repeat protein [Candidatus Obscuribacterales bacterium]
MSAEEKRKDFEEPDLQDEEDLISNHEFEASSRLLADSETPLRSSSEKNISVNPVRFLDFVAGIAGDKTKAAQETKAEVPAEAVRAEQPKQKENVPIIAWEKTLLDGELPVKAKAPETKFENLQTYVGVVDQWRENFQSSFGAQDARRAEKDGDINKAVELWKKEQDRLKSGYANEGAIFESCKELARLYEKIPGKSEEARKQYEAAIDLCKKDYNWSERWDSSLDPTVARLQMGIARSYQTEGKLDKAIEAQKQALLVANKGESEYSFSQKKDPVKIECRNGLAELLAKNGKNEEAVKEWQESIKLIKKQSGYSDYLASPQDKAIIKTQNKIADALLQAGKPDEALKMHEQNIAVLKRQRDYSDYLNSDLDFDIMRVQKSIADIKLSQNKFDEAQKALDENYKVLERKYLNTVFPKPEVVSAHAQYRKDMADLFSLKANRSGSDAVAQSKNFERAVQERQKEIDIYKKAAESDWRNPEAFDGKIFAANKEMIKDLKSQGKEEDALKIQEQQLRLLRRAEVKPAELGACYQQIAAGYDKIGQSEKAISMQKEACRNLSASEAYPVARERLAELYKKAGKDIRVEEAREDKECFDRCDAIEKFPYLFNKLP